MEEDKIKILENKDMLYFSNNQDIKNVIDDNQNLKNIDSEAINHLLNLTKIEKFNLSETIKVYKESVISWWLKKEEMKLFYKNFNIDKDEVQIYIKYFWWEKLLNYLITDLTWENIESRNLKSLFISTKFLSFIKRKNIWMEELLKITILLKISLIEHFIDEEIKVINLINSIFDEISTQLSKNYNDIVIKLLNEYTNAIDNSNIISKTDIYWNITSANDEFCKLSWHSREELIWKNHNMVRHGDMPKKMFKDLWKTIQSWKIWKWIIKNRTKDWWFYRAKATIVPILDENEKIVEYISIRTDISELVEANKNVKEYNYALNESSLVMKLNNELLITSVNEEYCNTMKYKEDLIINKHFANDFDISLEENYIDWENSKALNLKEVCSYIQNKNVWKWILKMKTNHWNYIRCSTTIKPILNSDNEIIEYIIIQHDVTDLEIAQQNFKISLNKQIELDHKKDEFLNIASHELRTPMTSIKWYISMILDWDAWDINEEVKTYLEQVFISSQRLLNLINDMLDISKIESWIQELRFEKIDLKKFIQDTCWEFRTLLQNKKQKLEMIIDFENFEYNTDINKLKQVLVNLIWNANKFALEGWLININSYIKDKRLFIEIQDDWIGIEKEYFDKIFEKFGQVKNSLTRDISWTWLGLTISKDIVEKLWWFIKVESKIGHWTKFIINLPI